MPLDAVMTSPMRSSRPWSYPWSDSAGRSSSTTSAVSPAPLEDMGAAYDQCSGPAWMPGANFGTRNVTFVPAPTAVSTTRP